MFMKSNLKAKAERLGTRVLHQNLLLPCDYLPVEDEHLAVTQPPALCKSNESSSDKEINDLVVLPTTTTIVPNCGSTSACQRSGTPE